LRTKKTRSATSCLRSGTKQQKLGYSENEVLREYNMEIRRFPFYDDEGWSLCRTPEDDASYGERFNLTALLQHSLCHRAIVNAPANRQMPIASVVRHNLKKIKK